MRARPTARTAAMLVVTLVLGALAMREAAAPRPARGAASSEHAHTAPDAPDAPDAHDAHDDGTPDAHENRVRLPAAALERFGVGVERAGPATVTRRLPLYGRVAPDRDRLLHVRPRFPGVVREARKSIGDPVRRGETLAVVESNESLRRYEVTAGIDGTVIAKHATAGELATAEADLYVIADLSTVWIDLDVHRRDAAALRVGQTAVLRAGDGTAEATAAIDYVAPLTAPATQTTLARAVLPNRDGRWPPGSFVSAEVIVEVAEVPVAVRAAALQRWRDREVIFVREGDLFEPRPVEIGRRDREWLEVRSGLAAGGEYVARGSFLLKAELGKAAASHDH
jgi:cobalt-zinc-cadmium efflux system membrane fusion protein